MPNILELDIALKHIVPKISRRVLVDSSRTLEHLHEVIQAAMGWYNCHLFQFMPSGRNGSYYGIPHPDFGEDMLDARKAKISKFLAAPTDKILYEYDFGDSWEHLVTVKKVHDPEPGRKYPVCLSGKRNCPPEDCGGPWGYGALLEALADPKHPEHEDMMDWTGGDFDAELFDLALVNARLAGL